MREVVDDHGASTTLGHLGRNDSWKKVGEEEEWTKDYGRVLVMGSIADIHGKEIVASFPKSHIDLILSKNVEAYPGGKVHQWIEGGEAVWNSLEQIIDFRPVKLSLLTYFLCNRVVADGERAGDGEYAKRFTMSMEGKTLEEKITAVADGSYSFDDAKSMGKILHNGMMKTVKKNIEAGRYVTILVPDPDGAGSGPGKTVKQNF